MDHIVLKLIHVACAALSYIGFVVRGVWMIRDSPLLRRPWVRVVPHAIDTALLASAIALAVMLRQYPLVEPWLTAKVVALLIYIGLGMVALRQRASLPIRIVAWIIAQVVFVYIVAVAITKNFLIIQ